MRLRLLLALSLGLLAAPALADDKTDEEFDRFNGTWRYVSVEVDGAKSDAKDFEKNRLYLRGKNFSLVTPTGTYRGTFTIDVGKTPKTLDVVYTEGPLKGQTSLGIYELEGDTYKVCLAYDGKPRPTEFSTKAGSSRMLATLKREKK